MGIYIRTSAAHASAACLIIEHTVTANMDDGQPLPPLIEYGILWCAVRRDAKHTLWRRIFLSASPTERAALPGALSSLIRQHNSQPRNNSHE